jgi:hypothetical protein
MIFGLFGGAIANSSDPSAPEGQGFKEFVEFNVEAEALGYRSTFQVEHHFTSFRARDRAGLRLRFVSHG